VKAKQSEQEIEIEKMMEGMQEARRTLAMAETAQKNMHVLLPSGNNLKHASGIAWFPLGISQS
jgi:transcriptional regulator